MVQTSSTALFLSATDVISLEQNTTENKALARTPSNIILKKPQVRTSSSQHSKYRLQIVWRNVIAFLVLHSFALFSVFKISPKALSIVFIFVFGYCGAVGITAGAHRLWAHRCYKAKWPLRVILMFFQTAAFQNHIYEWVRDHRAHHKFTDTNADPHNSKRGFFFSHMGWLLVKKHPDVLSKGKNVDMSDLERDPVVMWQKKHYLPLVMMCTFIVPTLIPYLGWTEQLYASFTLALVRYVLSLHFTWLVNSAAHIWGMKPYDKTISAAENMTVASLTFGEGFHNYHHSFPWDYKAAELGDYTLNLSTAFIDLFAQIGWAYDMKMATPEMVKKRARRTGDGTYTQETDIWGWDDLDMSKEDKKLVQIIYAHNDELTDPSTKIT